MNGLSFHIVANAMEKKLRSVNTKFWQDAFIEELNPTEKLLFLYFLTNPLTNLVGIYEVTFKRISYDTGLNIETIRKGFERFETARKAFYMDGFIILPNFLKNQNLNANMKVAAIREFNALPKTLKDKLITNGSEWLPNGYETLSNGLAMIRKEEREVEVEEEDEFEEETEDGSGIKKLPTKLKKSDLTSEELFEKIKVHYRAEWITARDAKAAEEENPDKDINLIYDIKRAGETLTKVAKCIVDNELAFVASLDGQLTYKGIMTNPVLMDSELVIEKILGVEESDPVHKRYDKGGNPKLGLTVLRWIANDKKG